MSSNGSQRLPVPATDRPRILVKIYSDRQGGTCDGHVIRDWFARHYQLSPVLDIKTKIVQDVHQDVLPDLETLERTGCQIAKRYDFFFFVFLLTKTADGRFGSTGNLRGNSEPGVSLDDILNAVKSKEGLTCNPKIFLIQADDNKLLKGRTMGPGGSNDRILIGKKIPTDADILIIECNIPRSIRSEYGRHLPPSDKGSRSVMLQAFMDEMGEKRDSLTTDLLTRTTYILDKVDKELKRLAEQLKSQADADMIAKLPLPMVTSTLTKLVLLKNASK